MINVVVKKEGVKSRTKVNSNKDLYQKLVVIGIIVVLVIGIFLFVNLRGVGKATEGDVCDNVGFIPVKVDLNNPKSAYINNLFCDGKIIHSCNYLTKGSAIILETDDIKFEETKALFSLFYPSVICDGSEWITCLNKFCPIPDEILQQQYFDDISPEEVKTFLQDLTTQLTSENKDVPDDKIINDSLPSLPDQPDVWTQIWSKEFATFIKSVSIINSQILPKGFTFLSSVDLAQNKIYYGYNAMPTYNVPLSYFKYNQKNYQIEITTSNFVDGSVNLSVKTLDNQLKGTLKVVMTDQSPFRFVPSQSGINLEGDENPEVYLTSAGFFMPTPPFNFIPLIFIVVNPKLDLNKYLNGTVFLSDKNSQSFSLNGEHTISVIKIGINNFALIIDGKEYTSTSGEHYFDAKKEEGVKFEVLKVIPGYSSAIIKLTKISKGLVSYYEDYFTKNKVLTLGELGPTVAICNNDPNILSTVTICNINSQEQILNLMDKEVKILPKNSKWLFQYLSPKPGVPKKVMSFNILDLTDLNPKSENALIFPNNLIQGKRLALKLDDKYYLLSHPVADYLDLTKLNLTDVSDTNFPVYLAEGDQEEIVFNLPFGKQINIKLNLEPEMSYWLSAKTSVAKTVNLQNELQTKVSTYGSVKVKIILSHFIGVSVSEKDTKELKNELKTSLQFQVSLSTSELKLDFGVPKIINDFPGSALMHYNKFINVGPDTYIKYADIYLYSDLTYNSWEHKFNSQKFIQPIVKGNQIAFGLDENYYLLGYSEPWDPTNQKGFEFEKLQLTTLKDSKKYAPVKTEKGYAFDIGQKKIQFVVDTNLEKITFESVATIQLAKTIWDLKKDYQISLPVSTPEQKNILELKGLDKNYFDCDTADTKNLNSFILLCGSNNYKLQLNNNQPVKLNVGNEELLVWFREITGNNKKVTFQKIFNLDLLQTKSQTLDWSLLVDNLKSGKSPILRWNQQWFELSGNKELSSFVLKKVPEGTSYPIVMESLKDGFNNGTFAVNENMLWAQQSMNLDTFKINIEIKGLNQKLVTESGFNVTGFTFFVPSIGAPIYKIFFSKADELIQLIVLKEDTSFFQAIFPEKASQEILLPNGESIIVEIINATSVPQKIKLKK